MLVSDNLNGFVCSHGEIVYLNQFLQEWIAKHLSGGTSNWQLWEVLGDLLSCRGFTAPLPTPGEVALEGSWALGVSELLAVGCGAQVEFQGFVSSFEALLTTDVKALNKSSLNWSPSPPAGS